MSRQENGTKKRASKFAVNLGFTTLEVLLVARLRATGPTLQEKLSCGEKKKEKKSQRSTSNGNGGIGEWEAYSSWIQAIARYL